MAGYILPPVSAYFYGVAAQRLRGALFRIISAAFPLFFYQKGEARRASLFCVPKAAFCRPPLSPGGESSPLFAVSVAPAVQCTVRTVAATGGFSFSLLVNKINGDCNHYGK